MNCRRKSSGWSKNYCKVNQEWQDIRNVVKEPTNLKIYRNAIGHIIIDGVDGIRYAHMRWSPDGVNMITLHYISKIE